MRLIYRRETNGRKGRGMCFNRKNRGIYRTDKNERMCREYVFYASAINAIKGPALKKRPEFDIAGCGKWRREEFAKAVIGSA